MYVSHSHLCRCWTYARGRLRKIQGTALTVTLSMYSQICRGANRAATDCSVYCTYSKPLLFKRTSLVLCVGIGEGSMSRWVTRNSAGAAIMFTQTFSRAPGQIYWRALRADCWYNQQLFEWVDEIYQSGREQEAIIPFLLVLLWKLIFKRISNLDICEFKLSIQWL